ncbi:MAG: DEAD/DEAH box helicase [Thermoanaerobaculia bacterium]
MTTSSPGLALSPKGRFHLTSTDQTAGSTLSDVAASRLKKAFASGQGDGVLFLAGAALTWELPPSLAFGREVGRLFFTRLCSQPDPELIRQDLRIDATEAELSALVLGAPPFAGAEYLDVPVLESAWQELHAAVDRELAQADTSVAAWLVQKNSIWGQVGRVSFHLAENKNRPDTPFAFLATYAVRLSREGKVQYAPLGRALQEGTGDRRALLALLAPVKRAAEKSPFIAELIESGQIFHPLAWSPSQAYRLLQEAPLLAETGILLKLPDWWSGRQPRRPEVAVTLGARPASGLGLEALLDFSVEMSLDGVRLTKAELDQLLEATESLVSLRGRWVEVDREKLVEALQHWKRMEIQASDGVTFLQGMRLLAGAKIEGGDVVEGDTAPAYTRAIAGPWLQGVLDELRNGSENLHESLAGKLRGTLRPYQARGVVWMDTLLRLGLGGCLADDMGLGKTIQVIALLLLLQRRHERGTSLLVVPASLLSNWTGELARFAPGLRTLLAHPSAMSVDQLAKSAPDVLKNADVVLTSYGTLLRASFLRETEWACVVLDEAQAIKNPAAKQTRAVKALKSRGRLALTGTPVENRLGDLWSLLDFTSPGLLGSPKAFSAFTKKMIDAETGYAPLKELVRPYILRRLKTDKNVIDDLPEKTEVTAYCTLARPQAALYEKAVRELRERLASDLSPMEKRGMVLSFLLRLKQICNHPSQGSGDAGFEPAGSGKFQRLAELCEEIAARQEKVLVFTQFQQMTRPLASFLATIFGTGGLVLDGTTKVAARQGLVDSFQSDDGPPFFVLSVKAGGTGLNLTAASHVIHFDRWWNPAVEDQATDRAFRIGQKKNVLVHKFVCRGTVEERIDALLHSKKSLSRQLLEGGGEVVLTELPDDELLRLVSLDLASALGE